MVNGTKRSRTVHDKQQYPTTHCPFIGRHLM